MYIRSATPIALGHTFQRKFHWEMVFLRGNIYFSSVPIPNRLPKDCGMKEGGFLTPYGTHPMQQWGTQWPGMGDGGMGTLKYCRETSMPFRNLMAVAVSGSGAYSAAAYMSGGMGPRF